jgi:hypothetical protein
MANDETASVMRAYFAALGTGQFSQFFTDEVTWTTIQGNVEIRGAEAVQEAIDGLHARMPDLQTRQLSVGDGMAYIEGSCAGRGEARVPYCVAYDVAGDRIAAMRACGDIAAFMPP